MAKTKKKAKKRIKKGFYWHVHHSRLFEWCYNYDERVRFIKNRKPPHEVKQRLKWFKPIKGVPDKVIKTKAACDKAETVYDKAEAAWNKADIAYDNAIEKHRKAIEKLHAKECPDCTWNGRELVFKVKK